jgi:hypothetical protein
MLGSQVLFRLGILVLGLVGAACQPVMDQAPSVEQVATDSNVHSPWRQQVGSLISFRGNKPMEPQFCVIVRTYWGHSGGQHLGLRRLIRSLQRQTVKRWGGQVAYAPSCTAFCPHYNAARPQLSWSRWEAIFLVMDDKPFLDLHHILSEFKDDRLWVFAEWVSGGLAAWELALALMTCCSRRMLGRGRVMLAWQAAGRHPIHAQEGCQRVDAWLPRHALQPDR